MTQDMWLVTVIVAAALVLFVTERIRVDLVALMVLLAISVSGLVTPEEAIAGFSNPVIVTICGVFVLSAGLYRSGVANWLGRQLIRLAGHSEARLILVIMLAGGCLSFFMNTVGIVALLLPVVMDIARRTNRPPSKLLMPLTFGALLGGTTTLFATMSNLLVSDFMKRSGLEPFGIFDYLPVGGVVAVTGMLFMLLVGRHWLPSRDLEKEGARLGAVNLDKHYDLTERMFVLRLPYDSPWVGRELASTNLGAVLGISVVGILRGGKSEFAPPPHFRLEAGDRLMVQGRQGQMEELRTWQELELLSADGQWKERFPPEHHFARLKIREGSGFVDHSLAMLDFRRRFGVNVLAIKNQSGVRKWRLQDVHLGPGNVLLVHGQPDKVTELKYVEGFDEVDNLTSRKMEEEFNWTELVFFVGVPQGGTLAGRSLAESRIGDALGITVIGVRRSEGSIETVDSRHILKSGEQLLVAGRSIDWEILRGLKSLEIAGEVGDRREMLESDKVGFLEVVLSPRTRLAGQSLRELNFREKYGVTVLGVMREGQTHASHIGDMRLQFGDAMLLYGEREKLKLVARDPDFVALSEEMREPLEVRKAPLALAAMAIFLGPVLAGWIPIHLGVLLGAVFMVMSGCLTIDKAYEAIHWQSVILVGGLLPLGIALQETGTARFLAENLVGAFGGFGPLAVIGAVFVATSLGTCVLPSAALVVLMAPIALKTAQEMGVSPYTVLMALAMAAAGSFNSPISHPSNLMIMGPGGYRFTDYLKVGIPLTLVVLIVVLLVLPIFWPLDGP